MGTDTTLEAADLAFAARRVIVGFAKVSLAAPVDYMARETAMASTPGVLSGGRVRRGRLRAHGV